MKFQTNDRLGYIYTVEVAGKTIRFIERLPNDEDPFIFEEFKFAPREYITAFDLVDDEVEAFREMLKNISLKIARMRNA